MEYEYLKKYASKQLKLKTKYLQMWVTTPSVSSRDTGNRDGIGTAPVPASPRQHLGRWPQCLGTSATAPPAHQRLLCLEGKFQIMTSH